MKIEHLPSSVGPHQEGPAVEGHPNAFRQVAFHKPHTLDAARGAAVVRDPVVLSWAPSQEEIASGSDGDIVPGLVPNLTQSNAA